MSHTRRNLVYTLLLVGLFFLTPQATAQDNNFAETQYFLDLIRSSDKKVHDRAFSFIDKNWKDEFEIMAIEIMYFGYNSGVGQRMAVLLNEKTNQNGGLDFNAWYAYLWNKEEKLIPGYDYFKSQLHKEIDPKFENYFQGRQENSLIRLDEIRWGGVLQDGIPPLRNPEMISVQQASYLQDDNIVFGIEVNGEARAYPKRILAWHEMFTDTVQGIPLAGVYCTLCGTVILYKTTVNGVKHRMGTSGFLYRSNKLMYDQATQSLWSTLEGKPVVGPLVGKDIQMDYLSVVTTTWGEWRKKHPETSVLSLNTGHRRDYGEGVAYKSYFADDQLMFNVQRNDNRLKNKESILAIKLPEFPEETVAISTRFLKKNKVYHLEVGSKNLIVLTDKSGANRVFEAHDTRFKKLKSSTTVEDSAGMTWTIKENQLLAADGTAYERIHTFNAFWFGWQAAYPDTRLIK